MNEETKPLFSAARWSELRPLLEMLADTSPVARAQELQRIAAYDADLAASLREMLADSGAASTSMPEQVLQRLIPAASDDVPTRVGPFKLLQRIGAGGMGVIYLAEREHADFVQRVALKLLDGGSASIAQLASRERKVLAALTHPNITGFVDAGVQDGRCWLAMEYVDGVALLEYARQHALDVGARVRLFDQICAAVAHAHAQLVVHRDLKPANVLVNAEGAVKLLDFGIALVLDAGEENRPATRVFTPEYAAPEQLRGERATTATDVYGLGLILYELVTGKRLPTLERTARDGEWTTAELARHATTRDAADVAAGVAARDLKALTRVLRGDLGRIIAHALNPVPTQRYASVTSLREDLARWLDYRPLSIGRQSPLYVARRFARRHRLGVVAATVGLVALLAIGATAIWQARAKTIEAKRARAALRQSEATRDFMSSVFLTADPYSGKGTQTTVGELLGVARARIDKDLAKEPGVAANLLTQIGNVYVSLGDDKAAREALHKALDANAHSAQPSAIIAAANAARLAHYDFMDGHTEDALPVLKAAVAQLRTAGPDARGELAGALRMRGNVLYASGSSNEAVVDEAEGTSLLQDLGDEHNGEYLSALTGLADLLAAMERYDEALAAAERGLAHPYVRTPEGAVLGHELSAARARALTGLERYAEAEPLLAQVIAAENTKLGPEHATTRYWRYRHAQVLQGMGRLDEARTETMTLRDVAPAGASNPVARTAALFLLASIDNQRRADEAAANSGAAIDAACVENGNPLFCAKANLLGVDVAIREHRTAATTQALDSAGKNETIAKTPALARRLDLLRARMNRDAGQFDAARALLAGIEKQTGLSHAEIAELDIERGYLALVMGERKAGIEALSRARETLAKPMTVLTPQIHDIDAALSAAQSIR